MRRLLAFALVAAALFAVPADAPAVAQDAGAEAPALLTVTGAVGRTNRPAMDPFADALFQALGVEFDQAFEFSRADLTGMPQVEVTAEYPGWPGAVTVSGPRLLDVLTKAGSRGSRIAVMAVDGYAPEFALEDVTRDFVLALEANGRPLNLGGRGPVWLVFPPDSYDGQDAASDAGLAWAVFHIRVLPGETLE
jgi:hypothetical protein